MIAKLLTFEKQALTAKRLLQRSFEEIARKPLLADKVNADSLRQPVDSDISNFFTMKKAKSGRIILLFSLSFTGFTTVMFELPAS